MENKTENKMESENVYEAPQSDVSNPEHSEFKLASRWARFGASIIDTIILMVIFIPALYLIGFYDSILDGGEPSLVDNLIGGAIAIVVFFAINLHLLINYGQTVGKKICSIKIVTMNNQNIDFKKHILPRYAVYFLP